MMRVNGFAQVKKQKENGDYPRAKKYANIALGLTIVSMVYVLVGFTILTGMTGWALSKGGCSRIGFRPSTSEYCKYCWQIALVYRISQFQL